MFKIGKHYYKTFWAFVLRKPEKMIPTSKMYDPYEDMDSDAIRNELLYGNFHEDCGDR